MNIFQLSNGNPLTRKFQVALIFFGLVLASFAFAIPAQSQPVNQQSIDDVLAEMGAQQIRAVNIDICYPATSQEYEAVGKHAVLMLNAKSAIGTELPLKSVYLQIGDVKFPLRRISLSEKHEDHEGGDNRNAYTRQISFYIIPISMMKLESQLTVDFQGGRSEFSVASFPSANGFDSGAPAFVRLDEYDTPSEPNTFALIDMIAREYPTYFD